MTHTNAPERLAYSIDETARAAGVSRDVLYALIRRGQLRTVKIGERRLVPRQELFRITGTLGSAA